MNVFKSFSTLPRIHWNVTIFLERQDSLPVAWKKDEQKATERSQVQNQETTTFLLIFCLLLSK